MVKNAKNVVNNDGLTEQLVMIERDYKMLVESVRKADSSSYLTLQVCVSVPIVAELKAI